MSLGIPGVHLVGPGDVEQVSRAWQCNCVGVFVSIRPLLQLVRLRLYGSIQHTSECY